MGCFVSVVHSGCKWRIVVRMYRQSIHFCRSDPQRVNDRLLVFTTGQRLEICVALLIRHVVTTTGREERGEEGGEKGEVEEMIGGEEAGNRRGDGCKARRDGKEERKDDDKRGGGRDEKRKW